MRLLLDTHIWLWSQLSTDRVKPDVARILQDPSNEVYLSPISTWEALLQHKKGRLYLSDDPHEWILRARSGLVEAPLTHEVAANAVVLDWDHRDPADRFLAATAATYDLTLVTADRALLALNSISTLSSR